ncbi:uncharacterized protein J3R85_015412 [Psidium guajava]|nr:uncharacterized protein J3R85_015412 [Psidium guajava]
MYRCFQGKSAYVNLSPLPKNLCTRRAKESYDDRVPLCFCSLIIHSGNTVSMRTFKMPGTSSGS